MAANRYSSSNEMGWVNCKRVTAWGAWHPSTSPGLAMPDLGRCKNTKHSSVAWRAQAAARQACCKEWAARLRRAASPLRPNLAQPGRPAGQHEARAVPAPFAQSVHAPAPLLARQLGEPARLPACPPPQPEHRMNLLLRSLLEGRACGRHDVRILPPQHLQHGQAARAA